MVKILANWQTADPSKRSVTSQIQPKISMAEYKGKTCYGV